MGMMSQFKQAMQMRNEAKKLEAEVKKISAEYTNGGITVVVKGDMSVERISILPEAYEEVVKGKPERFETMLLNVVNGAIRRVREEMQKLMMKQMEEGNMPGLFGK